MNVQVQGKCVDFYSQQPNIMTIKNFIKVISFCVELNFSPNTKCNKNLMIIFPAN